MERWPVRFSTSDHARSCSLAGAGGMGQVYKARDTRLDRTVAIKILPPELAADPQFRERFDREARVISQLDHPHICALYDVGDAERRPRSWCCSISKVRHSPTDLSKGPLTRRRATRRSRSRSRPHARPRRTAPASFTAI